MSDATNNRIEPPWKVGDVFFVQGSNSEDTFKVLEVQENVPSLIRCSDGKEYGGNEDWRAWRVAIFQRIVQPRDERVDDLINDYHTDLGGAK